LRELRVIEELAAVHRRVIESSGTVSLGDVLSAPPPPSDSSEGVPWGPLLVLDQIGGGSFGKVYRARDPLLDHEVALKRLRLPANAPSTQAASIVREGQLLARVRHQNVITVHGACEINGEIGIWMEFVRGKTLEQLVQDEGPMSAQEASVVGESLCRALAAVHKAGLLHRDVKASNVMREAGGRIVMLDFGTGTEAELDTRGGPRRMAGTPLYMAPELFEDGRASVQSDLYSLGVLLFHLVTGEYPVRGKSLAEVRAALQVGERRLLSDARPDLPRNFVRVVERALCRAQEDRYQSVGAMLRDLSASEFSSPLLGRRARNLALGLLASATLGIWSMGFLASLAFNQVLSRVGGFGTEPLLSYWVLGFQSLIALSIHMLLAVLLVMVLRAVYLPLQRLVGILYRRISWLESVRNKSAAYASTMRRDASLLAQLLVFSEIASVVF
jgi:serine/threonine-protein kinase